MSSAKISKTIKKTWTCEEDQCLQQLVELQGTGNWNAIASHLYERTGKQCRERYHNHLQPNIKKGGWTDREDEIIMSMQTKIGNQWARITSLLPGRTDNAVKNRWHAVQRSIQLREANEIEDLACTNKRPAIPTLSLTSLPKTKPILAPLPIAQAITRPLCAHEPPCESLLGDHDHSLHSHELTLSSRSCISVSLTLSPPNSSRLNSSSSSSSSSSSTIQMVLTHRSCGSLSSRSLPDEFMSCSSSSASFHSDGMIEDESLEMLGQLFGCGDEGNDDESSASESSTSTSTSSSAASAALTASVTAGLKRKCSYSFDICALMIAPVHDSDKFSEAALSFREAYEEDADQHAAYDNFNLCGEVEESGPDRESWVSDSLCDYDSADMQDFLVTDLSDEDDHDDQQQDTCYWSQPPSSSCCKGSVVTVTGEVAGAAAAGVSNSMLQLGDLFARALFPCGGPVKARRGRGRGCLSNHVSSVAAAAPAVNKRSRS